MENPEKLTR